MLVVVGNESGRQAVILSKRVVKTVVNVIGQISPNGNSI